MPKNFPSGNKSEWKIFENHHKQLFGKRGNRFSGGGFFLPRIQSNWIYLDQLECGGTHKFEPVRKI